MSDLVLRGGTVVDGTGAAPRLADVLVRDRRIVAVGSISAADAAHAVSVDCTGLVVAPGFIDPHTHYDAQVLWDPGLTPSTWHGVTTVVMGNCGFGIAPTREADRGTVMRVLENVEGMPLAALQAGIPWTFETFPEYLDALEALPLRVNVAALIGHTPLRLYVMGDDATEREATDAEVASMKAIVAEAIEAGAIGFSTSRSASHLGAYGKPVPSRAAALSEIWALAGALGDAGKGTIEATWGPDLFVDEFARMAEDIGRPVSWAAIMAGRNQPGYSDSVAERVEVGGNVHPQVACRPIVVQIALNDPFPFANVPAFGEILARARADRPELYLDPEWRARADPQMRAAWGDILDHACVAESAAHPELQFGATLAELAAERGDGATAIDVMVSIARADGFDTRFLVAMTNDDEDAVGRLLGNDQLLLGLSDAGAHTSQLCDANYATHLLGHWVREKGLLSLEKAVWRLTGHPAMVYGMTDRGVIAEGAVADLVAFDPDTVGTTLPQRVYDFPGGADRLVAHSIGIRHVWVGGTAIRSDDNDLAARGTGRLLRNGISA
ncbi:MAG: Amidohydrolase 3 [Ilumatobacteraceae bacterium]|nr:Amidohydrolase 3 [Ilumatobacteraceae bacterium]